MYRSQLKYLPHQAAVFLLCAFMLTSCGSVAESGIESGDTSQNAVSETETAQIEEVPSVTSADYGGKEFKFLMGTVIQWESKNDFGSGEENGDVLNDAYYARNRATEEALNITLTNDKLSDSSEYDKISKLILAGDNTYDAIIARGYAVFKLAQEGYLLDLADIDTLDLSHSWWDAGAVRDLTFGGHSYVATGDISTIINDSTSVMLFNKTLIENFSLENPYELVNNGKWTIDKFSEMEKIVACDLDGNGTYDQNDRYGALIWDDSMMAIVNAVGGRCCTIEDDEIELTFNTELIVNTVEKYLGIVNNTHECFGYQRLSGDYQTIADNMFTDNRSLFYFQLIDSINALRNMKTDFGIIPYPKYDEAQEEYYTNVASYPSVFAAVPINTEDTDMAGAVLEMLGYTSQQIVRPAYYEKTLVGKYIRDDESEATLDLVFSTRVYDVGWLLEIGGYNEEIMNLYRKNQMDFSSMYAKFESSALTKLSDINAAYENID